MIGIPNKYIPIYSDIPINIKHQYVLDISSHDRSQTPDLSDHPSLSRLGYRVEVSFGTKAAGLPWGKLGEFGAARMNGT